MSDLMYKATDKAAWDAYAASVNLTAEGNPVEGVYIDEIGPIVTTPAVYDAEGNIVTPAVMDNHFHVNVRVLNSTVDCAVLAEGGAGVEWVDPATVDSPARIWAGGMNYWMPAVEVA